MSDRVIRKEKLENFDMIKTIGSGSFGRVKLARFRKDKKFYAMKILKKAEIIKLKQIDHIQSEISILSQINHPFLIKIHSMMQNERHLYLVMEYVAGGELFTHLRTVQFFKSKDARFYAAQVTLMFEYLHSKKIVYRDLKPENLLLDTKGYLKLTDFGFAKVVETRTFTLCGTPEYLAPEVLLNKGHGRPVDWWCLGILIYEMIVGIDPFTDDEPMNIYQNILRGKIKFPKNFDSNAKSLVKHLLVADLGKRYGNLKNGANDIKKHRWFNDFDWKKLLRKELPSPFTPKVKSDGDTQNFSDYNENEDIGEIVKKSEDPFLNW